MTQLGDAKPPQPAEIAQPNADTRSAAEIEAQAVEVAAALEVWKKGLLTVSGATRLINYRPTKSRSVPIDSPPADDILLRLDAGNDWVFEGRPDAPEEDASGQSEADGLSPGPRSGGGAGQAIRTPCRQKDLGPLLRSIMRQANTEWLDRGLHVLYLALGMLHWKDVDQSDYASPLVLVPVELVPIGPKDVPRLRAAEDEPLLNPALRVQLERLGVVLPSPEDLDGVAVSEQYDKVRATVASRPGWHVTEDMVLAMFSFHKEAMYKDLIENAETILSHPIVQVLGTSDPMKQSRRFDFSPIEPADIDRLAPPETTPVVLDADSSQRAAVAAAVAGHSFVMDGPPGTGKSQTIANMIGALLHSGKSVLFVSEKAAALEVVRNRLERVGLLPYLFELHSSKTSRKEVALELLSALQTRPVVPPGMNEQDRQHAATQRESLSEYAEAMNETRHPLNRSVHDVLGRISQLNGAPLVPIPSKSLKALSEQAYWRFGELANTLHLYWRPAEQGDSFLWKDVLVQVPIEEQLFAARQSLEELRAAMDTNSRLARSLGLSGPNDAAALIVLVNLQHGSRPEGTLDDWLVGAEAEYRQAFDELGEMISASRRADAVWLNTSGVPWTEIDGFPELVASRVQSVPGTALEIKTCSAGNCVWVAQRLNQTADSLEKAVAGARRIGQALGLPRVETATDVERVLILAALCSAPHKPPREWFTAVGVDDVRRASRDLSASVSELDRLEAEAKPYFTDSVLHAPVEELLARFKTQHRGLGKLSSAYRADKRRVAEFVASDVKVTEGIKGLEKAVDWAKAHFRYQEGVDAEAGVLASYWQGRRTNFDVVDDALAVVHRAHEGLMGLPMNELLLANLTSTGAASFDGAVAEVRRDIEAWRLQFQSGQVEPAGVLASQQWLLLEPLDAVVGWLREQAPLVKIQGKKITMVDHALGRTHSLLQAEQVLDDWSAAHDARTAVSDQHDRHVGMFGDLYRGTETDLDALRVALDWARKVRDHVGGALTPVQAEALATTRPNARLQPAKDRWDAARTQFLNLFAPTRHSELESELNDFAGAFKLFQDFAADPSGQLEWFQYRALRTQLDDLGLDATVQACIANRVAREQVPGALERALLRGWANQVVHADPRLTPAMSDERQALVERFQTLDTDLIHSAHSRIIAQANARKPNYHGMGEQGVIQREGSKKTRHMPVRELISRSKGTVLGLKPCFMMSPLAVSQYLPPDIRFDVVIFDEASQVTPSDAVNCVYRGHALILAGDDKQLPPTSFFEKMNDDDIEDEVTDVKDFESVLELAKASGALRNIPLRWHYRSADDALINYSNYKFYDGKLVVFPGPGNKRGEPAVTFHKVEGRYRRGASADNPLEATAVAARVIEHFNTTPSQTLGVVTFSVAQASAVLDAIDRAREGRRDLDQYFDVNERLDAFFVKSLESVQGDERDKIIFSIGYGPDENGKITTNFGVLNRDKGWRRLNVAITRARRRVEVVSSMRAGDIPPSPNENVEYLRAYLDYADRGLPALAVNLGHTGASPESPFEESVIAVLSSWGFHIEPQVGSAGYRIDIGIRHPEHPGLFLLGVECDGYQYHSAPAARDRDRLREQVLRRLGWQLHRIWGTAWYRDREGEEARLRNAIADALAGNGDRAPSRRRAAVQLGFENIERLAKPAWALDYAEATLPPLPRWIDVSEPGAGFDMEDSVRRVIEIEGPIHIDILDQRLRDAWDIGRIGARIRANIDFAIKRCRAQRDGDFLAMPGQHASKVRTPSGRTARKVEQIHEDELALAMTLLLAELGSSSQDELQVATARLFGWGRTGAQIQGRLEPIIENLVKMSRLKRESGLLALVLV
ncbi:MAG: DUF3320 domain-containing protein [Brooklawnia sp.]|nr:DUF3320 domain-containing protein [Brooklawnia sp.]